MTEIRTLAALKRHIKPGMRFECVNHLHPDVSGPRWVRKAQTNAISFEMPDGRIGWTEYLKADRMRFDGGTTVTFLDDDADRSPAFTYTFPESA